MNRKARRARNASLLNTGSSTVSDLLDRMIWCREHGEHQAAEGLCERILSLDPVNVRVLNVLGLIFQQTGRHRSAVKALEKSVALDPSNAPCHFNLANSYCALDRYDVAAVHFKKALILDDSLNAAETLVLQNPVIARCVAQIEASWPITVKVSQLFTLSTLRSLASDLFLRCALKIRLICGLPLESFFTNLRLAIVELSQADMTGLAIKPDFVALTAAIAQQCFINEYVYAVTEKEAKQAAELKAALRRKIMEGDEIPPLLLTTGAAYFPLQSAPEAHMLLKRSWPEPIHEMLRVQLIEPLEELADCSVISTLTPVGDEVSLQVKSQYEENPYPRWITSVVAMNENTSNFRPPPIVVATNQQPEKILIAGCGTGKHAIETALTFPASQVLAIDLSLPSLSYARRKSREFNVRNIEYVQADILNLSGSQAEFDRIEAVGVLHHLGNPEAGWQILLSMLKQDGVMRVGLYSEVARREIVELRKFILERGYQSSEEDIRKCRQEIIRKFKQGDWGQVVSSSDFYSLSGCRDMLFNVMEHRFTIPRISAFLQNERLSFLGFDLPEHVIDRFRDRFADDGDSMNLDKWNAFELENPRTFMHMYQFEVRKN